MKFTKMHGAGNDYVFVDARSMDRDWPSVAVAISDRHKGIGSDGLILVLESGQADLRMRMFNADGSEAEMCGNGIRCFVRFALDNNILTRGEGHVSVETGTGVLNVTPIWDGDTMVRATVGMGEPHLHPDEIPVLISEQEMVQDYPLRVDGREFRISCVSMGNPHAVAFIDEPVDEVPLHEIGPQVENHALFPNRVNFEIVNIIDSGRVKARVWERGSGLTEACGTGACAIAVAAHLHGFIKKEVSISLPGGDLIVRWPGQGEVILEGPVESVFNGEWSS